MATNLYSAGTGPNVRSGGQRNFHIVENILDAALTNQAQNDVAEMLAVAAGYWIFLVGMQVLTLEGGALTADTGITGVDADAFLDGTDLNTGTPPVRYTSSVAYTDATDAGNVESAIPTQLYGILGGKFITTADTIDIITLGAAADLVKLRLTAALINMDGGALTL